MIEVELITFLSERLGVPVYAERPSKLTADEFLIIEKTAGGATNHIEHPTIAIQSHAKTLLESAELNERVKDIMSHAAEIPTIGMCRLNSDYNFTDASMKEYRYQAVYNLSYKEI